LIVGIYSRFVLPHLLNAACSHQEINRLRQKIVPLAEGRVLEIGIGSGINLRWYDPAKVEWVWAIEPSEAMRQRAQPNLAAAPVVVKWLDSAAEQISLEDESVDTIVLTYTLCSIEDWRSALQQMRRVLKHNGRLLFCEHGLSCDTPVQTWQHRLTPVWKPLMGGCHLNRPVRSYLEQGGFTVQEITNLYLPQIPRFAGYMSYGQAIKV
jgi:ubiquinone/menaquinone biosynthesis C-methylase UbiE